MIDEANTSDICLSVALGNRYEVMAAMFNQFYVVLTSFGSRDEADLFAETAVSQRLAACVNVLGPAVSTYRWRGEREKAEEFLALAKTSEASLEELVSVLKRVHSYELPEVTVLKVSGSAEYVGWVTRETRTEEP